MATGIVQRHARGCAKSHDKDASCSCRPSYQAWAYDPRTQTKRKKTFPTLAAAKSWRVDALRDVRDGTIAAPNSPTLRQAAEAFIAGARDGSIRNRSGDVFKPSVIRSYETSLRLRVLPDLGARRLSEIERRGVQDFADRLLAKGLDPSTIRNTLMPLRAIFRRAVARGDIKINPTSALELPAVRGSRDRIASPDEAARFLAIVPEQDRALWATALYGGLRRGELKALTWADIDLGAGVLRVERSWDREGVVEPKSRAGRRLVPIPAALREHLIAHKLRSVWSEGFAFGRMADLPFNAQVGARAARAVEKAEAKRTAELAEAKERLLVADARADREAIDEARAEVEQLEAAAVAPLTLHEARHTYASLMIAAGVNPKALSTYMGHSSITITLDRYGHMFPGNEDEAAALLDGYLARTSEVTSEAC